MTIWIKVFRNPSVAHENDSASWQLLLTVYIFNNNFDSVKECSPRLVFFFFFVCVFFFYGGSVSFGCDVFINHASWKTNSMHVSVASFPAIKKYYLDLSLRLSNFSYGEHETLSCWVPRKRTDTLLLIKHGLQVRIKKKKQYICV